MSHHTGLAQMPHKYHREAPDTFRGRASIAKEFIEEVEIILTQYKVTTDLDKIKGLLRYCSRSVTKFIRTLHSFHSPDWERLKTEFLHYYDAEQEDDDNRPSDLVRFVEENKHEPMESLGAWLKYYRDYMTMATPLVNNETLSDRHYKTLFWMGIPDDLQRIFEFRLQATIKTYTPHDPYTIEEVSQVAEQHFERNKFTEMFFNAPRREPQYDSSDTDSDYADHRRGRRSQRKPKYSRRKKSKAKDRNYSPEPTPTPTATAATQRYKGSTDEIEGMIKQLNTMSLQDPEYGSRYFKVLQLDTTGLAAKCITREPLQVSATISPPNNRPPFVPRPRPPVAQAAVTFPNSIPVQQGQQPRFSQALFCYGCSSPDHMMGECPQMKELADKGIVLWDPTSRKYYMANGTEIIRNRGETLAQSATQQQQSYVPSTNWVTIADEVASFYQGEASTFQEEDDLYMQEEMEEYQQDNPYYHSSASDSETEDEPKWKQVLRTQQAYPVDRSSKRSTEARREVNKVPSKPTPGKSTFDGVWPPLRNSRPKPVSKENIPPNNRSVIPPAPPRPTEDPPKVLQPIDARKPRFVTDEMIESKPKKLPPRDPSPHISTNRDNMERTRGPARQSELSSQVDVKAITNEILDSEITIPLRKILGTSKDIANTFQDLMRAKNKTTLPPPERPPSKQLPIVATGAKNLQSIKPNKGRLIKLRITHEGNYITAIVDTGSEINIIKEDIALGLQLPIDMSQPIQMNDANGGVGQLEGLIPDVKLMCGSVTTNADLYVASGRKIPFDLLLGRPWQEDNYVSIVQRRRGTYLEFLDPNTDKVSHRIMVTSIPYQDYHDYPPSPEAEFEEHRHETHRQANRGVYTLAATQTPELIMNDMFDPPQPVLLPYSSFFDTLAPLQIQEEELGTQIPITEYPSDDEETFFDFSTVNTSLQPPGIIIQSSEQEQNRQMLREILESSMEDSSRIMSSSESHSVVF